MSIGPGSFHRMACIAGISAGIGVLATALLSAPRDAGAAARSAAGDSLRLQSAAGVERFRVVIDEQDSVVLQLKDARGKVRMALTVAGDGTPRVEQWDGAGIPRVALAANENGDPYLTLRDGKGADRVGIQASKNGPCSVALYSAPEAARVGMSLDDRNGPSLFLRDGNGNLQARLSTGNLAADSGDWKPGEPLPLFEAGVTAAGGGVLVLRDPSGKVKATTPR